MNWRTRNISLLYVIASIILLTTSCKPSKQISQKEFKPDWESLKAYKIPEWFANAKFGIFIHWGVYSVPAFHSEWYPRLMYQDSMLWHQTDPSKSKPGTSDVYLHHVKTYGLPSVFGYKDFIPMFKAEHFDPVAWVDLFKKAGARYIVPVAEHHDGFAMYHSHVTRWNAVDMGPKRDVIGELEKATHDAGLKFGVSSHYAFNWDYYNHEKRFDTSNPKLEDLYGPAHKRYAPVSEKFMAHWWKRTKDIIDSYHPEILWFDFYIDRPEFSSYHPKLAAYYYNMGLKTGQEVVLQTKNMNYKSFPEGTDVLDIERGSLSNIRKDIWQTDTSIGKNTWGYTTSWESKSANSIIDDLADIVSKNGNLLLNVGPKSDGTIPQDQANVLLEIGSWLSTNGEAIYSTRPWIKFGEGPTEVGKGHHSEGKNKGFTSKDIRFTTKKGVLYAIVLDVPEDGKVLITSLADQRNLDANKIDSIEILGAQKQPEWKMTNDGLLVSLKEKPASNDAFVIKIKQHS